MTDTRASADTHPGTGRVSPLTTRVVDWLRAGYPAGVPRGDYVALLGLLRRTLTDEEVQAIGAELTDLAASGAQVTTGDVERLINDVTLGEPSAGDVARVSSHLAAGGWPLADVPPGG